jgi:hypothetical protein
VTSLGFQQKIDSVVNATGITTGKLLIPDLGTYKIARAGIMSVRHEKMPHPSPNSSAP